MTGAAIDAMDGSAYLITEDTEIHVLKKMLVTDGEREEWEQARKTPWYKRCTARKESDKIKNIHHRFKIMQEKGSWLATLTDEKG